MKVSARGCSAVNTAISAQKVHQWRSRVSLLRVAGSCTTLKVLYAGYT
jgi:hypothetical protein